LHNSLHILVDWQVTFFVNYISIVNGGMEIVLQQQDKGEKYELRGFHGVDTLTVS
jgi:hypothetical protein